LPADQKGNKLMSIQEVPVERFAQLFHYYHQALADSRNTAAAGANDAWADVPPSEKSRMIAAARLALLELAPVVEYQQRPYFAKPGEAEWGC